MYHADDQNGGVVIGEVAEGDSCISHPPCYSYPGSAESHFENDLPTAFPTHGMTDSKLTDAEGVSRGPCITSLDSGSAVTNTQFEPSGRRVRVGNTRLLHRPEPAGDGEQLQSWEEIQKGRLLLLEELADILACIFAEAPPTGTSGCSR